MSSEGSHLLKIAGKNVVKVYLLDNSMKTLLIDDDATARDIVREMAEKLGIRAVDQVAPCLSIHECADNVTIEAPLSDETPVMSVLAAWDPTDTVSKLVLTVKLYTESLMMSLDPKVIYLFYIQGVYNVVSGIYPTGVDECISLAALQMQAKFGDHNPSVHKQGYLSHQLKGLFPASLLPRKTPSQWEAEVLSRHSLLLPESRRNPQWMYVNVLKAREYYGCAFFPVSQSFTDTMPKYLCLGINVKGVFLLQNNNKAKLTMIPINDLARWGFKPEESFYYELKVATPNGKLFTFNTVEGSVISELLTDYAMMLVRELTTAPTPGDLLPPEELAYGGDGSFVGHAVGNSSQNRAATKIQCVYRGYVVRCALHQVYAATRIQAGLLTGVRERVVSSTTPPSLPTVGVAGGFPASFHRNDKKDIPQTGALPTSKSRFAQAMRASNETSNSTGISAVTGDGNGADGEESVMARRVGGRKKKAPDGEWVVDDRTRQQNKALIESMSREEMDETLDSIKSVLGAELFEKLRGMYTAGKSLRDPHGDAVDDTLGEDGTEVETKADTKPVEGETSDCGCYMHQHASSQTAGHVVESSAKESEEPYSVDDKYETRQPTDVLLLCRSAMPSQRVAALRRLGALLSQGTARDGEKFPRMLPIVVRCAVDDTHASVVRTGLEVVLTFLGAESAVSTRSDASSQHDVDMNSWEEVGFPCYRGQEASPLRKLHWNMYPLPRTRDGASGQGGSGGDTGELNGDDEDDEEVDSGILDPDAELALSQRGYGLIQMGLLARLLYLIRDAGSVEATVHLCIRVVIACARCGPSAAWAIIQQSQLLKELCDRFLASTPVTNSAGDDVNGTCLVIRLLRCLAQAGRGACEALEDAGYLDSCKRFLTTPGGGEVHTLFREAIRLWRVCMSYGIDTDAFEGLFPPLQLRSSVVHFQSPSSETGSVQSRAEFTEVADVLNVLEVLCPGRVVEHTSPPTFDNVLDSQLCTFVKSSLPALSRWTGSPVPTEALPAWGALLHFLASYYDLSSFSSFDSSLTGLVSSEGMSGDVSPWCIPVSVLSVSLQSRTRVAQWLWDSVVSLLWTAPFALRQYCEAIIAEQQPTAEMLAVVNVVHGVLRLTRSLFTIVPGWAPWSAQWSSASEVLCAVLESCGTVADRIWGHSTSPLLYMTVDENPQQYQPTRIIRQCVLAGLALGLDKFEPAHLSRVTAVAARLIPCQVPGDELATRDLLSNHVLSPNTVQLLARGQGLPLELKECLGIRSLILPLYEALCFSSEELERSIVTVSARPKILSKLLLGTEAMNTSPSLVLSQHSGMSVFTAPLVWSRLPALRPTQFAESDWKMMLGAALSFVCTVIQPYLVPVDLPLFARALLEVGLCPPAMLVTPSVRSVYCPSLWRVLTDTDAQGGGKSAFPQLQGLMGETRLNQLGLSLVEHFGAEGFGVDASTLAVLVFLRADAPAVARSAVWREIVGSGVAKNITLPSGVSVENFLKLCQSDVISGDAAHTEVLVSYLTSKKLRRGDVSDRSVGVLYWLAVRQIGSHVFRAVDAGSVTALTPAAVMLLSDVVTGGCELVVVKDIVTDCDSSLLPGRLAAVAAVSLFTDMFPKTQ